MFDNTRTRMANALDPNHKSTKTPKRKRFGWLSIVLVAIVMFITGYIVGYFRGENVSGLVPFTDTNWDNLSDAAGTTVRFVIGLGFFIYGLWLIVKKFGKTDKEERWLNVAGLGLAAIGFALLFWSQLGYMSAVLAFGLAIALVASLTLKNLNKVSSANTPPATLAHHTDPDVTATAVSTTGH